MRASHPHPAEALNSTARRILGEHGLARFEEFRAYDDGWDFGEGRKLSSRSVAGLNEFLVSFSTFERAPSLFLTREGNLQLGWEDPRGDVIELEVLPDSYSLYVGETDEETEFARDELPQLIARLPQPKQLQP